MSTSNVDIIKAVYEAFARGDVEAILAIVDGRADWATNTSTEPHLGGRTDRGQRGVADFFTDFGTAMDVEEFTPLTFAATGDEVLTVVRFRARSRKTDKVASMSCTTGSASAPERSSTTPAPRTPPSPRPPSLPDPRGQESTRRRSPRSTLRPAVPTRGPRTRNRARSSSRSARGAGGQFDRRRHCPGHARERARRREINPSSISGPVDISNLKDYGPVPALDAKGWINSPPLTPADLKGKVVLYDFWTYSCINCLRTFPYLRSWFDRYTATGS